MAAGEPSVGIGVTGTLGGIGQAIQASGMNAQFTQWLQQQTAPLNPVFVNPPHPNVGTGYVVPNVATPWAGHPGYHPGLVPNQEPLIHPMMPSVEHGHAGGLTAEQVQALLQQMQAQHEAAQQQEARKKLNPALLRPVQVPLYDTEVIGYAAVEEMRFFERGLGQDFADVQYTTKTPWHTNVGSGGRLVAPDEFSLLGFSFAVLGVDRCTVNEVRSSALFEFWFNEKLKLQVPLFRVPVETPDLPLTDAEIKKIAPHSENVDDDIFASARSGKTLDEIRASRVTPVEHYADEVEKLCERNRNKPNFYDFSIETSRLRIRPTDSFSVRLRWPDKTSYGQGFRVVSFLEGTTWRMP